MSRQNSQKTGVRSDAQKQDRARDGYNAIPPSNEVGGAHGNTGRQHATDNDVSLKRNVNATQKKHREEESE